MDVITLRTSKEERGEKKIVFNSYLSLKIKIQESRRKLQLCSHPESISLANKHRESSF